MKDCTDIKILRDHRRPRGGGGIRGQTSLQNSLNIYTIKLPKICLSQTPPRRNLADPRMHRILYLLNITFLKDKKHNCRTGFVLNIFNILNHLIPGCNLFCNIVRTITTIQYAEKMNGI